MESNGIKLLLEKIHKIRLENSGKIDSTNFDKVLDEMLLLIKDSVHEQEEGESIYKEITEIANNLRKIKDDFKELDSSSTDGSLTNVSSELTDINNTTTKYTLNILNSAENINKLAVNITDLNIKNSITAETTKIFEACNFQDLTQQQIKRIQTSINDLEKRVKVLFKTFLPKELLEIKVKVDQKNNLTNGPQKDPQENQGSIDDLFN